jgi:hypothetical protein
MESGEFLPSAEPVFTAPGGLLFGRPGVKILFGRSKWQDQINGIAPDAWRDS